MDWIAKRKKDSTVPAHLKEIFEYSRNEILNSAKLGPLVRPTPHVANEATATATVPTPFPNVPTSTFSPRRLLAPGFKTPTFSNLSKPAGRVVHEVIDLISPDVSPSRVPAASSSQRALPTADQHQPLPLPGLLLASVPINVSQPAAGPPGVAVARQTSKVIAKAPSEAWPTETRANILRGWLPQAARFGPPPLKRKRAEEEVINTNVPATSETALPVEEPSKKTKARKPSQPRKRIPTSAAPPTIPPPPHIPETTADIVAPKRRKTKATQNTNNSTAILPSEPIGNTVSLKSNRSRTATTKPATQRTTNPSAQASRTKITHISKAVRHAKKPATVEENEGKYEQEDADNEELARQLEEELSGMPKDDDDNEELAKQLEKELESVVEEEEEDNEELAKQLEEELGSITKDDGDNEELAKQLEKELSSIEKDAPTPAEDKEPADSPEDEELERQLKGALNRASSSSSDDDSSDDDTNDDCSDEGSLFGGDDGEKGSLFGGEDSEDDDWDHVC
ncbi:hypothetical protein BDW22DRAFT_1433029 [Trametopsis cervina]|nr:hypothetical protein BDW22DRAFT_1433029 [Trametopsis cervina]